MNTWVLAKQAAAVNPDRFGKSAGFLSFDEMRRETIRKCPCSVRWKATPGCRRTPLLGVAAAM
ncbi:MAG: hypothetical protein WBB00_01520 [Mycobacterium sp.]